MMNHLLLIHFELICITYKTVKHKFGISLLLIVLRFYVIILKVWQQNNKNMKIFLLCFALFSSLGVSLPAQSSILGKSVSTLNSKIFYLGKSVKSKMKTFYFHLLAFTCISFKFTWQHQNILPQGVNFINVLHTAFMRVEPKSVKKTVKLSVFLRFWDLRA